ncbi:hypothetical protein KP509_10G033400 [Ceratopteris richardii]|uniref:GTD-binding domain-containing protein n=1 Tax=Ceratopteris richardii TaxID=49495 RepID=A0A8T2U0J7_CERRI|nr:hypothetical protein KP509_10G033400 [Ceratopteris richardii]KAH7427185.1 hypothetical protein KP509_10G033400 [Ceratopteris richardii]KAH7427186.1 hypothetical protein KP509_10G033400 [Ceratopteris richardii]
MQEQTMTESLSPWCHYAHVSSWCLRNGYGDLFNDPNIFEILTQLLFALLVFVRILARFLILQLIKWRGHRNSPGNENAQRKIISWGISSPAVNRRVPIEFTNREKNSSKITDKHMKRSYSVVEQATKQKFYDCSKYDSICDGKKCLSFKHKRHTSFQHRHINSAPSPSYSSNSPQQYASSIRWTRSSGSTVEVEYEKLKFLRRNLSMRSSSVSSMTEISLNSGFREYLGFTNEDVKADFVPEELQEDSDSSAEQPVHFGVFCPLKKERGGILRSMSCVYRRTQEDLSKDTMPTPNIGQQGSHKISKSLLDGQISITEDVSNYNDSESLIRTLQNAYLKGQKKLSALCKELEVERISSETAAIEAMCMISRLQGEKATLYMEIVNCRRVEKERGIYLDQVIQHLKRKLFEKERENYLLKRQVMTMGGKYRRDVTESVAKKKEVDGVTFHLEGHRTLLVENRGPNQDETHRSIIDSPGRKSKRPFPWEKTPQQPSKRLKLTFDNGNSGTFTIF